MVIASLIMQLVWAVIAWNMNACWRVIIWTIGVITLPIRALSALHREKVTARHFEDLQIEIDSLLWNHRRLETQYALAIKERKMLESMLCDLEEEHDKAIDKIENLEKQVQNLKTANLELGEIPGKRAWDRKSKDDTKEAQNQTPSSLTKRTSSTKLEDTTTRKGTLQKETKTKGRPNPTGLADPVTPLLFSNNVDPDEALYERRDVALSQSVFSALLSLLVGTVVYESKEPCTSLVLALFVVVGMSLKSVVYFLSTINNKPASDAIALLSFNWFILGALTYPTLPVAARFVLPHVSSFMDRTIFWFAY